MTTIALNHTALNARRLAMNLSIRQVADSLAMKESTYRFLELGTSPWESIPIGFYDRLADLLDCTVLDLFVETVPVHGSADAQLVAQIGSLLLTADRAVSIGALAEVCGTDTGTVEAAVDALRGHLEPAGIRVTRLSPELVLTATARPQGAAATRRLLRRADARGAVLAPAARLLQRAARGTMSGNLQDRGERQQLARALKAGWVDLVQRTRDDEGRRYVLNPDVVFSLILDDGHPLEDATATVVRPVYKRMRFRWQDGEIVKVPHTLAVARAMGLEVETPGTDDAIPRPEDEYRDVRPRPGGQSAR